MESRFGWGSGVGVWGMMKGVVDGSGLDWDGGLGRGRESVDGAGKRGGALLVQDRHVCDFGI